MSPWLGWETNYVEILNRVFVSSNFDNVAANLFADQLGQKLIAFNFYSCADTPS